MKFDDIIFNDMPTNLKFHKIVNEEFAIWELYEPTTIDKDLPLGSKWWCLLYWVPKIKKQLYLTLLQKGMPAVESELYDRLGIDQIYFTNNYDFLLKKMKWMQKNYKASKHLGESI